MLCWQDTDGTLSGMMKTAETAADTYLSQDAALDIIVDCTPAAAGLGPRRRGRPPKSGPVDLTRMIDRDGIPVDFITKRRDYFKSIDGALEGDEWMVIFMAFIRRLLVLRISGDTRLVIDWICLKIKKGNSIANVIQSDIAADCGMSRTNVCTVLTRLEKLEIVLRGRRGSIYLNPRYLFHGTPAAQREAIKEWDQLQVERQARLAAKGLS